MLRLISVRNIALFVGAVVGTANLSSAFADNPNANVDALVAEGEALAKAGNFSAATEKWKAADKLQPRAKHACLIGLAYTRREYWPQAEVFFARCRQSASATDPVPTWLDAAEKQLEEKLAIAPVAAVKLSVDPPSAAAEIIVSSFAPDEAFGPRVVHLGIGSHTITVTAPGYAPTVQVVEVKNKADQFITIQLKKPGESPTNDPNRVPLPVDGNGTTGTGTTGTTGNGALVTPPPQAAKASPLPWVVVGAGGAMMAAGAIMQATWFKSARDQLVRASDTGNSMLYAEWSPRFDTRRNVVIGMYGVGAATIATGIILKYTVFKERKESPVAVGAAFGEGGGMVTLGWSH